MINQNASNIALLASKLDGLNKVITKLEVTPDGVKIYGNSADTYVIIKDDGLHIYVNNSEVAYATSTAFVSNAVIGTDSMKSGNWQLKEENDGKILAITRL